MKCPKGRRKTRFCRGRGRSAGYARSMKGHSWQKLFNQDKEHIGRKCTGCNKIVLNARGIILNELSI